jgi:hypothetical protein
VNSFYLQVVKMCVVFQSYQQDFQALQGFHQPGGCLRDQEFGGCEDWKYNQGLNLGESCFVKLVLEGWRFGK